MERSLTAHGPLEGHRAVVVVVGAGFAGLFAVRELRDAPVEVVLVDANNFHTFQPLLYQVATAGLDAEDVAFPVRGIVRGRRGKSNVTVRMARVTALDLAARRVTLDGVEQLGYDWLILATGAVADDLGIPGVAAHAFALKDLDDAIALRAHVLNRFELAATDASLVAEGGIDVVVCGGGPTGVEMAGALAELYTKVLAKDFPGLPVGAAHIVLVEPADRLLTPFHPTSSARAARTLRRRGVEVRLGVGVARVHPDRVELTDGTVVPTHTAVWASGVAAEGLAAATGAPTVGRGRLVVEADLSLRGHPEVFAVGDLAAAPGCGGDPLPQVAQPAMQGGRHAARQILRRLDGLPTQPFVYRDKGRMATIGRHAAITELPNGWRISGPLGWLAWLGLHLVYLLGFRNRINVLVNWAWNYVTYDRGSRILRESERQPPAVGP